MNCLKHLHIRMCLLLGNTVNWCESVAEDERPDAVFHHWEK